jgi:excisionase family DNA binding protein
MAPRTAATLRPFGSVSPRESPWITPKEAADYLHVGVDKIYEACALKGLRHTKLGHSTIRLRREWIDQWAESLATK